ncbi:NACHT domain-containing protein [Leptolyngbya sp. KIOST-1]|uniref:NACHT domain-containing protein n=1 Tax=Leptolyngbya sp. KIOST-1 TaxID=1229172 RepID=UPI000907901E|nr:NACHT domain-containing protein [Leptolyngbya sp. KIOST-1]
MSGSGGSGGYEYQDNAVGYVAAHILAARALDWELETGALDIPTAVAVETNGPGDDLCITLQNNVITELQAKHGLTKDKLFNPLLKLAKGLHENPAMYGVLLTDSSASLTIRRDLRQDLVKLGQERYDRLKSITLEFQDQLSSANLPRQDPNIFRRLRIIVLDLDDDLQGAKIAQNLLSNLISDQNQASLVWKILCDEGRKLASNPGRRDIYAWRLLLQKHSIFISGQGNSEGFSQQTSWPELCRKMLPTELDSNPLISGDGVTLGIEDILPLDLAERKERPRPTRDPSPENSQQALEEQEVPLPYDQLFVRVLSECRSLNQQGKGIAIIGEPGAGKTTLLCAIANWILKQDELPIFVSLRDLDSKLEDYVLQTWLRQASNALKASEQLQDALVKRCNARQVWLLLDGIDEMSQADRTLYNLAQELGKGWLSNARVVLTCRINIWDANRNDLGSNFQSFRSRGLKHGDQTVFIRNFFAQAQQPETGEKLIKEIKNAPFRLKDLIKSPLWLTLLCRTWKRRSGKLPKTKTELYRGFVNTLYEWKNKPCIPVGRRHLLERALGEISKRLIDREVSRFSFSESFICEELNRFDPSFFGIACELGWINKLGIAAGNSEEPIYTFLHPTFQEYFAAKAVHDDHFFLHHIPDDPSKGRYRVLEPQWKECFLFWLGREDVSEECKNHLIEALANLADECDGSTSIRQSAWQYQEFQSLSNAILKKS